jgi:hypothetical protein
MATVNIPSLDTLTGAVSSSDGAAMVVIDFGKHKRKAVKALRQGSGKLMDDLNAALDELRSSGAISPGAQPVILVVEQRRRRVRGLLPSL